jgi:hypothetical protein
MSHAVGKVHEHAPSTGERSQDFVGRLTQERIDVAVALFGAISASARLASMKSRLSG